MGEVVELARWRTAMRSASADAGSGAAAVQRAPEDDLESLERTVDRLQALVSRKLDARGRLDRAVETELLAIIGELTMGMPTEAARRAERLAARLSGPAGGG